MINWFEIDYWRTFETNGDVLPFSITLLPDDTTGEINPNFKVSSRTLPIQILKYMVLMERGM